MYVILVYDIYTDDKGKKILPKVNKELRLEDQIKEALKLMLR